MQASSEMFKVAPHEPVVKDEADDSCNEAAPAHEPVEKGADESCREVTTPHEPNKDDGVDDSRVDDDAAPNQSPNNYRNSSRRGPARRCQRRKRDCVESNMTKLQMTNAVRACLRPSDYKEGVQFDPLIGIQTIIELRKTYQEVFPLEDLRHTRLSFLFSRNKVGIGPTHCGAKVFHTVIDEAKLNAWNRVTHTGFVMHVNPLLCAAGWIGISFLYRFNVMGEPFPNFLAPSDFSDRPLLRQVSDYKEPIEYEDEIESHKKMLDLIGFTSKSVTDLGRRLALHSMSTAGVPDSDIRTIARYLHTCKRNKLVVNVPRTCMVHVAGGNPSQDGLRAHNPSRSKIGGIDNAIIDQICPYLRQEQDKVEVATRRCGNSFKLMKQQCLINAKGSLVAIRDYIEAGILLAASRPRNEHGVFCEESIYRLYRDHPVFKLDFWSREWFVTLSDRVRNAELQEGAFDGYGLPNRMGDWTVHMRAQLNSQLAILQRETRYNRQYLRAMLDEMRALFLQTQRGQQQFDMDLRPESPMNSALDAIVSAPPVAAPANSGAVRQMLTGYDETVQNGQMPTHSNDNAKVEPVTTHMRQEGEQEQQARKRKRPTIATDGFIQSKEILSVKHLWTEYAHGLNGGPAIRDLEAVGMEWRADNARRQFFNSRRPIYVEIERLMGTKNVEERDAVDAVEELHGLIPKKGKRSKHALKLLAAALRCFHIKHGYTEPYTFTKMPSDDKICEHFSLLKNYEF